MLCPKCSTKMTILFTSVVCDTCNPPKGHVVKEPTRSTPVYYGWARYVPGNILVPVYGDRARALKNSSPQKHSFESRRRTRSGSLVGSLVLPSR
jgi:hypothetical protein